MDPVYVSAISALFGSAIGALASLATTWLTYRHQDESRRRAEESARLARIFEEFIDLSSKAFLDALVQASMEDPSKFVPLYATRENAPLRVRANLCSRREGDEPGRRNLLHAEA